MNTPKIEIKGHTATGKSSLAWAIKDALEAHGIKCEVTGCEDERPGAMDASWRKRIKALSGKTVTVETIQLRRDACCPNSIENRIIIAVSKAMQDIIKEEAEAAADRVRTRVAELSGPIVSAVAKELRFIQTADMGGGPELILRWPNLNRT